MRERGVENVTIGYYENSVPPKTNVKLMLKNIHTLLRQKTTNINGLQEALYVKVPHPFPPSKKISK